MSCARCKAPISTQNRTGFCRKCALHRNHMKARLDPKHAETFARLNRQLDEGNKARSRSDEWRKKVAIGTSRARLGWLPDDMRAEYFAMVNASRKTRKTAAEARVIMEAKIADRNALRSGLLTPACDWLRRWGPVTDTGNGYRFGSSTLSPGEVITKAKALGWKPAANDMGRMEVAL